MKSLKSVLLILLSFSFISCALQPPNVEVCGRLRSGAICAWTLDGPERRLTESEWKELELGRFSMSPEHYGEIKKFILKACLKYKSCEKDTLEKRMSSFDEAF